MEFVRRFERRLEGAVGDTFARIFGGTVVPAEVEAALQREADDNARDAGNGVTLAPNHYVLTVSGTDEQNLAADRELAQRQFSRHLTEYIASRGWQTYGDVVVTFEQSESLHTGQLRTRGVVNPDATVGNPPPALAVRSQTRGPAKDTGAPMSTDSPNPQQGPRPPANQQPRDQYADADPYAPTSYNGDQSGYDQHYGDQSYGDQNYSDQTYSDQNYGDQNYDPQGYYDGGGAYAPPAAAPAAPSFGGQAYSQQPGPDYTGGYVDNYGYGYPDQRGGFGPAVVTLQLEDGSGRSYQLRTGSNIVGRGQDAQFRLPDTGVSRRHFDIRWDGQVALLADLGSTNGTTVNNSPIGEWQLADGDVIRAGHSEIVVRFS